MRRSGCGGCGSLVLGLVALLVLWATVPAFGSVVVFVVGLTLFGLAMGQVARGLGNRRSGHDRRSAYLSFGRQGRRRDDRTRRWW